LLVRGKESHQLWHLDGFDHTGSVHVEVSPGSWEVSLKVSLSSLSSETSVGVENLGGSRSGVDLAHPELSVW